MADHSKMHHCQHRLVLKGLFNLNEKHLLVLGAGSSSMAGKALSMYLYCLLLDSFVNMHTK